MILIYIRYFIRIIMYHTYLSKYLNIYYLAKLQVGIIPSIYYSYINDVESKLNIDITSTALDFRTAASFS